MERYDQLYRLYGEFNTAELRAYQQFVDLFPPLDSPVALDAWQDASEQLDRAKDGIREGFPEAGETYASVAATASREQAFTALDLLTKYERPVNVLVLDVDETLRSAGKTDNEIPRETLHRLTELLESGVPIVVCTGQTLENVKGFLIQGLGSELVHSGDLSIVYEAGTGVFTPGYGPDTKRLLYEDLDADTQAIFRTIRSEVLSSASDRLRHGCHLQGNEFNVTLKPNFQTGGERAREIIDEALVHQLDLLGPAVLSELDCEGDPEAAREWARAYYAAQDTEIRAVLEGQGEVPSADPSNVPEPIREVFERIDVAYYEADAAEIGSLELNKVVGVRSAFDVLGIDDPFCVVMGDSKSDRRVMEWVEETDSGIGAAPEHASEDVLEHVMSTDELVYEPGVATEILGTVYALNELARLES